MKAVIHYYSATGNTARAVGNIADRLKASGHEAAPAAIAGHSVPPDGVPEWTILAFPTWSWGMPHFVLEYVRRMPKGRGARAGVLSVCGGFGGQAAEEAEHALRKRGYEVVASGEAAYPDNWTMAKGPPEGEELARTLAAGDAAARAFADDLLGEAPAKFRCGWAHKAWTKPMSRLFRRVGRRFMGKAFAADGHCTGCGFCETTCPVRAIRLEGVPVRPRWNASCAGCFRCINLCPERAIQVSTARLAIHLGANLAATAACLWGVVALRSRLPFEAAWIDWVAAAALGFAALAGATALQLTAGDAALHWLETRPALKGLFMRNYTGKFGRYRAPGFHPGKNSVLSR